MPAGLSGSASQSASGVRRGRVNSRDAESSLIDDLARQKRTNDINDMGGSEAKMEIQTCSRCRVEFETKDFKLPLVS